MTFPNKGDKFLKKVVVLRRWEYYKIIWLSEIADTPHPLGTYIPQWYSPWEEGIADRIHTTCNIFA